MKTEKLIIATFIGAIIATPVFFLSQETLGIPKTPFAPFLCILILGVVIGVIITFVHTKMQPLPVFIYESKVNSQPFTLFKQGRTLYGEYYETRIGSNMATTEPKLLQAHIEEHGFTKRTVITNKDFCTRFAHALKYGEILPKITKLS